MIDFLELGTTPTDEMPEQLGANYDESKARLECRTFIAQLKRTFGPPPQGSGFRITHNPHDFGTYLEVVICYSNNEGMEYASNIECNIPEHWDEQSKNELGYG